MADTIQVKKATYGPTDEIVFELLINGETVSVVYRSGDPYAGELGEFLAGWIEAHADKIGLYVAPPEPTLDERRAAMSNISARQLRLTLVRNGFSLASIDAAITALPEGQQKDEALIEWEYAHEFQRVSPTLNSIAAALGIDQNEVDLMWQQALAA